ncbi:YncE family protein [Salininema proteolyticum]|uniref:DNA-binding beta-propeller fold protein YncE n=1 Tax=Salininema proteolyticum TaxID=1607685 RepID=A0ABV8TSK0_9ACTN
MKFGMAVAAALAVAVAATPALAAEDDDEVPIDDVAVPLPAYADLEVVDEPAQVFLSGGPTSNGLAVYDATTGDVELLADLPGASGMARDGDDLYVALASGDAIAVLDVVTLEEKTRIGLDRQTCPEHMAIAERVLYFGYGCGNGWTGGVGSVALDDPELNPTLGLHCDPDPDDPEGECRVEFHRAPLIDAQTGRLLAAQLSLSQATVHTYHLGASPVYGDALDKAGAHLMDVAFGADGDFYTGAASKDYAQAFGFENLDYRGSYPVGGQTRAVAPHTGEGVLAVGGYADLADVAIYELGGVTPVATADLCRGKLAPRGLEWNGDATVLYGVTLCGNEGTPRLHILDDPLGIGDDGDPDRPNEPKPPTPPVPVPGT